MKILVITHQFPKLSETFIINHISALIDIGHKVQILASKTPLEEKVHPSVKKYKLLEKTWYFNLPKNYFSRWISFPRIILRAQNSLDLLKSINPIKFGLGIITLQSLFRNRNLPKLNFDIIHCHFGHIAASCLSLRRMYNAPLMTSFHGYELARFSKLGRIFFWHLFRYGDGFIANSEYTRKRLEDIGCPSDKIEKILVIASE